MSFMRSTIGENEEGRGRGRREEERERELRDTLLTHEEERLSSGRNKGRRKSLVSLASEDDLLGRRMKGLVSGLTGVDVEMDGHE
jgi:hypothetical protein